MQSRIRWRHSLLDWRSGRTARDKGAASRCPRCRSRPPGAAGKNPSRQECWWTLRGPATVGQPPWNNRDEVRETKIILWTLATKPGNIIAKEEWNEPFRGCQSYLWLFRAAWWRAEYPLLSCTFAPGPRRKLKKKTFLRNLKSTLKWSSTY